jgi:hypothetical protein
METVQSEVGGPEEREYSDDDIEANIQDDDGQNW